MGRRTLCGLPPTKKQVTLKVPNGKWRPDTVITDVDGNEKFVLMEMDANMRGYEAIFGDLEGRKLCCVRRKLFRNPIRDGYYICTYRPSIKGQPALMEKDVHSQSIYPFSFVDATTTQSRFKYSLYTIDDRKDEIVIAKPRLVSENPWMGFYTVFISPVLRFARWSIQYRKPGTRGARVTIDQWENTVKVERGQDVLASLCLAYIFDKCQCQPKIPTLGEINKEYDCDNASIDSGAA